MPRAEQSKREIRAPSDLSEVTFDPKGLIPVVSQDARTGEVLMVAWANREAIEETLATRILHFWSRSRDQLWKKGETSGNTQSLVSLHIDCDGDTLLALVDPAGPACHTGQRTCFGADAIPETAIHSTGGRSSVFDELQAIVEDRDRERPPSSYTTRLLEDENLRIKKLGEEVSELIASLVRGEDNAPEEAADLVYHMMVSLQAAGCSWRDVERALEKRRGTGS